MQRTPAINRPGLTAARPVAHTEVPLRSAYLVGAAYAAAAGGVLYEFVFAHFLGWVVACVLVVVVVVAGC
jgi:hypothetical protein